MLKEPPARDAPAAQRDRAAMARGADGAPRAGKSGAWEERPGLWP